MTLVGLGRGGLGWVGVVALYEGKGGGSALGWLREES